MVKINSLEIYNVTKKTNFTVQEYFSILQNKSERDLNGKEGSRARKFKLQDQLLELHKMISINKKKEKEEE